jgi:hypothetical protein
LSKGGWRPPPWYDQPGRRIGFVHQLGRLDGVGIGRDPKRRSGFAVSFTVTPKGVPTRSVTVQFLPHSPIVPRVYVDGPSDSPHRYDDGTLCMWHPKDAPPMRWTPEAGPADLVIRIAVHLIKEEWFRRCGEWVGEEVTHDQRDEANDPERS